MEKTMNTPQARSCCMECVWLTSRHGRAGDGRITLEYACPTAHLECMTLAALRDVSYGESACPDYTPWYASASSDGSEGGESSEQVISTADVIPPEADWEKAFNYLNMMIAEYVLTGAAGWMGLQLGLVPLRHRYDKGERTPDLYDSIMAIE